MRTVADLVRLLEVDRDDILRWTKEFAEHLSDYTRPQPGRPRYFTQADTRTLAYIKGGLDDIDSLRMCLSVGGQHMEEYVEWANLNTPIFQEVPDDIDETWTHGVMMISGYQHRSAVDVARAYRLAGDELIGQAVGRESPHALDYPIFFNYRHAIELYLKIILDDPKQAREIRHDLKKLIEAVEKKLGKKADRRVRNWLHEFAEVDPASDLFRYADEAPEHPRHYEMWIDLLQLQTVVAHLCEMFEDHILKETRAPSQKL